MDFDQLWSAYEKGFGSIDGKVELCTPRHVNSRIAYQDVTALAPTPLMHSFPFACFLQESSGWAWKRSTP